ncbi:hypothetical protein M0804_009462 [Polistes exclamans]|nr:hypothetical protein M0804_009462 [Polistes exclamans]
MVWVDGDGERDGERVGHAGAQFAGGGGGRFNMFSPVYPGLLGSYCYCTDADIGAGTGGGILVLVVYFQAWINKMV